MTGDVKYLFRDYDSDVGRWLSRDPIEERGGKNLYVLLQNDPLSKRDYLGMGAHLAPLNGEVFNDSSATVIIEGDWKEVYFYRESNLPATMYPWSYADYWSMRWNVLPQDHYTGERDPSGKHTLPPGTDTPSDWRAGITQIVDADFITGSTLPVYDNIFCLFKVTLPYKIGPFRVTVKDCRCRKGVYILGPT